VNNKQIVVTGLKDMVIPVVIFSTYITWMIVRKEGLTKTLTLRTIRTIVEFFKYILGQLKRSKKYVTAGKLVKHYITLNVSCFLYHNFGGSKIWT
jgi:hypothetical protein